MLRSRFAILLGWAALAFTATAQAQAQEPIRFARMPDISPDGKTVAFSYLGDIWTVETIGGIARPVTMHQAHDVTPVFSPDGRQIAFASNRHGSYDVYVVDVHGGKPKRLTFDSGSESVCGWTPDGKSVLFASTRGTDFPSGSDLYTIPAEGGREKRVTFAEAKEGIFSPRGDQIAYVRGQGIWYRKGYRGSSNDDIWICQADGTGNRQLTTFNGQDTSPMWAPDGQTVYYVSEVHGTPANIVKQDGLGKNPPQFVTLHKDEAVRRARMNKTGEWIVYECGPDLYVASTKEGVSPRKLAIEVHADDKANTEANRTFTSGATEFALSADEQHIAFVVHGDLFMMKIGGNAKPTRLTDSPAFDHGIAWAPDASKIIFTSDRDGHEDLYALEANDPEHPKFLDAHRFKVTPLTNTADAEIGVTFSPDGKRVSFLRAGKLWTMNPNGTDAKVVINDPMVIDYDWSPDSKWIVYAKMDGSFASDLWVVPSTGVTKETPARNITRHATFNADVTWSAKGKKICFVSERRQQSAMYTISLQKPAAPGAPASDEIDWDDIHLRAEMAAPIPAQGGAISVDGARVAFRSAGSAGDDLWVAAGGQFTRITTGNASPQQIVWSKKIPDVLYFRDGGGNLKMAKVGGGIDFSSLLGGGRPGGAPPGTTGPQPATIPFMVKMTVRQDEEFGEMFEQSWRALAEHFYDPKFHGIDWEAVRSRYRPLVKHCAMKEDLYSLISLMMGELNASHLGIGGFGSIPEEQTADLGLIFDPAYQGPGLKVAEVLKRGPADKRGITVKPGEIIVSIDETDLTEQTNLSEVLNGKIGDTIVLQVTTNPTADPKDPKARRRVEIQGANRAQIAGLMYERWVARNAKRVAELSGGKLGYIHIPSMDEAGLDRFVRSLYSDNFDKEGIVLDVRYNGGGFTHDQVLNYLGAKAHALFRMRDGGEGAVLRPYDRKWNKPLVLLINQRSYSDAEIFPNAFRTLGLGKLVGVPTGGYVIGTSSIRLIDGSMFRIPRIGVFTMKGVNMEKEGVPPDVLVQEHPDQLVKGIDVQLEKAVEVVQADVVAWKKKAAEKVASKPDEKPMPVPPMPPAGKE